MSGMLDLIVHSLEINYMHMSVV